MMVLSVMTTVLGLVEVSPLIIAPPSVSAEFPEISGDGSTVAFLTDESSSVLGDSSNKGLFTPFSFPVDSPSQISQHVPFAAGTDRNVNVQWIGISQTGEFVFYTAAEDYFSGNRTFDFRNLYLYRSDGSATAGGDTTGTIPGGIGTESDPDVTAIDRNALALLLLALAASIARGVLAKRHKVRIRKH